jgi:hypothetical protein
MAEDPFTIGLAVGMVKVHKYSASAIGIQESLQSLCVAQGFAEQAALARVEETFYISNAMKDALGKTPVQILHQPVRLLRNQCPLPEPIYLLLLRNSRHSLG